jgi:hypothetical protein
VLGEIMADESRLAAVRADETRLAVEMGLVFND